MSKVQRRIEGLHFRQMMFDPPQIWRDKYGRAQDLDTIDERYLDNILVFCENVRPEYKTLAQYGYAKRETQLRINLRRHQAESTVAWGLIDLGGKLRRDQIREASRMARRRTLSDVYDVVSGAAVGPRIGESAALFAFRLQHWLRTCIEASTS